MLIARLVMERLIPVLHATTPLIYTTNNAYLLVLLITTPTSTNARNVTPSVKLAMED